MNRKVYQEYCEVMSKLSLRIMELLGLSLGVGRSYFRDFFEGNCSVLRLNYYPPCQKPDLTLGTGPHCDPTSLTILHQDDVGGLQVYVDNQWQYIYTNFDALVVNIGDTFMVTKKKKTFTCRNRESSNILVLDFTYDATNKTHNTLCDCCGYRLFQMGYTRAAYTEQW